MWWRRGRRRKTSNPGVFRFLNEDQKRLAWKRAYVSFGIYPEQQVNTYVFLHRDKKMRQKNDCKRVCLEKVFPQLYIWLLKKMTLGMCFHKNMGTRMCMRMQKQQWKGNAIVFPTLTTIVLGNAYVIFLSLLRIEIRSCFYMFFPSNSPAPLSNFAIKSKGNDMHQEQNHMTNCKQKRQNLTRKITYTQPKNKINIISI